MGEGSSEERLADWERSLTRWIRLAGDVVSVNPSLRPQILETLRLQLQAQQRNHLLFSLLMLLVMGGSMLSLRSTAGRHEPLPFTSASQLQQRAVEHAQQHSQSIDWSLLEVFAAQRELALSELRFQRSDDQEVVVR